MIRYITKWALTQGILEVEGEYTDNGKYFLENGYTRMLVGAADAFQHLEYAKAHVSQKRKDKISSLLKQIAKLEKFEPKVVKRK